MKYLRIGQIFQCILIFLSASAYSQSWHSIGPSGEPTAICFSSDYVLIGTGKAGIEVSNDNCMTWKTANGIPIPQGMPTYLGVNRIMCIKHDPNNSDLIYAGTGPDETSGGEGFYKSSDGGKTWYAKNSGLGNWTAVLNLSINPFHTNEIYIYCRTNSGSMIYVSKDSAETWHLFYNDYNIGCPPVFNPSDSTVKYGVGYNGQIYTWKDSSLSIINPENSITGYHLNPWVFINPKTSSLFYGIDTDFYRLENDSIWVSLLKNLDSTGITFNKITDAAIDQKTDRIFLCTDKGVLGSDDDGESWFLCTNLSDMKISVDSWKVYMMGYSGTYFSGDDLDHLDKIADGPQISSAYSLSTGTDSENVNYMYLIGSDNSYERPAELFKSTNKGISWHKLTLSNGALPLSVKANPLSPRIVYVGYVLSNGFVGGVLKSYNGGNTWTQIYNDSTGGITNIKIPSNDTSTIVLVNGNKILESENSGQTWEVLSSPNGNVTALYISNQNPGLIYAGFSTNTVDQSGFYATTDSGLNWERRVNGIPNGINYANISVIYADPQNENTVYLGDNSTLYKSTNGGEEWERCGFPSLGESGYVNDIRIAPDNSNLVFAAVTGSYIDAGGFYISTDSGHTWEKHIVDLYDNSKSFVDVIPDGNIYKIFVGTMSYGCYLGEFNRTITSVHYSQSVPSYYSLFQNYPNPFNPSTTISYSIPKASFVTIKIYDVLGREVKTLVNKNETTGNYSVNFNASNLSSGIYFYEIKAGSFVQVKKMILLK